MRLAVPTVPQSAHISEVTVLESGGGPERAPYAFKVPSTQWEELEMGRY